MNAPLAPKPEGFWCNEHRAKGPVRGCEADLASPPVEEHWKGREPFQCDDLRTCPHGTWCEVARRAHRNTKWFYAGSGFENQNLSNDVRMGLGPWNWKGPWAVYV